MLYAGGLILALLVGYMLGSPDKKRKGDVQTLDSARIALIFSEKNKRV